MTAWQQRLGGWVLVGLSLVLSQTMATAGERRPQAVSANFEVTAPTPEIAQQVAQYAERWRQAKAREWLGKDMPNWGQRCPIRVTVTPGGAGGATTFAFDGGAILEQDMHVEGSLERILNSVLPHEVTHTVFAYHFRQALPRWADEGGCVLSEDDTERRRHDQLVRQSLASGRGYRLRVLFSMKEYPRSGEDIMTLYAQGYSVVRFLVEQSNKPAFLNFLNDGMRQGWDQALQRHYGYQRIEELEAAWLQWLRNGMQMSGDVLARDRTRLPAQATVAAMPPQGHGAELGPPRSLRSENGFPTPQQPGQRLAAGAAWSPTGTPQAASHGPAKLLPIEYD
ncbi:MAG TPA: hypothetical protein PKD86_06345 [Gemmatales bacterium]|nr:hypothetical protein [Gemmatales bacterium]HMP58956.1 hypothetical protein [Gemmatales bacterium]